LRGIEPLLNLDEMVAANTKPRRAFPSAHVRSSQVGDYVRRTDTTAVLETLCPSSREQKAKCRYDQRTKHYCREVLTYRH
jgi:hypothetical protein